MSNDSSVPPSGGGLPKRLAYCVVRLLGGGALSGRSGVGRPVQEAAGRLVAGFTGYEADGLVPAQEAFVAGSGDYCEAGLVGLCSHGS